LGGSFLKCQILQKILSLKCRNQKKSKGKEKYKIAGNQQFLPSGKSTIGQQVSNN
jgi:hypothetical protein